MNTAAISYPNYQAAYESPNHTLAWAVAISLCLHLFAVFYLPNFQHDTEKPLPPVLNIQIEAPKAPEPVESPVVEPAPEPPKPKVKPKIEPKVVPVQKPTPIETYEPVNNEPEVTEEPVSAPVMSVAPTTESQPVVTVPPPPPPPPPGPSQADLDAARKNYANKLAHAIAQHKQYPRVAQMRGWQGEALVDLKLDSHGALLESRIARSSGYDMLDKQALEMIKKAAPFPSPPDILKSSVFNIQVPVSFKLE
ncbi:MAG: energy transducer TonB [Betaproteobacteria bacterium HGW-Betaproteobacteria-8]|nr:MAG: energy transducer TonB [Betaproteobacteria bacterium HGW-Betaproteobacteria-8]